MKFLKISGIVILVLFLLIFSVPMIFQGKILKIAKEQINNNLNARADFDKLSLSLIRSFPNVSVGAKNLSISGIEKFEGDTLFSVKSLEVVVDLMSAIRMENIQIRKVIIDYPRVHAWVMPDGEVNWDIVKDTGAEEDTDTVESDLNPRVDLKRFEINHGNIVYDDDSSHIRASLNDFNFAMTGDLAKDFTTLSLSSNASVNALAGGIRYLKDVALRLEADVDADMKSAVYTLRQNSISLNELTLRFDGKIGMPNDTDMVIDLKYGLDKADFKSLLSLVPAIYMKDFQDIKTAGKLSLNGEVKGTYNENTMPNAALTLLVEKAMFKYPSLPKSASNIGIDVDLFFDGVQNDNSTVDVNKFHVDLGGNPIDMTLNLKTPVSDMHINGSLHTQIDLATLADVVPLDSTTLSGRIKAALDFMGYLSYIENEQYEKFKADGSLQIQDLVYSSSELPKDLSITEAAFTFSPRFLEVNHFDAVIGKSDLHLTGKAEDFIPYLFSDGTLKGSFIFTSEVLDLNEFMSEETESIEPSEDTVPLTVFEVPEHIDFKLISRLDKVYYDKLKIENAIGTILVKECKVILDGLQMHMLNGTMQLSGEYNTQDVKNPLVDFNFKATSIDIPSAFSAFTTLQKFAPLAEKAVGNVTLGMQFSSFLDDHMMPRLASIAGKGNFFSDKIGLKSSKTFSKIGNALNSKSFDNLTFNKLGVDFTIRNGRLLVSPFETKAGDASFIIGGDQGLDQTMNYSIAISIPREKLGSTANVPIDNLLKKAGGAGLKIDPLQNLNFKIKVGGSFNDPKVGLNLAENSSNAKEAMKDEVKQAVQEQIDIRKEEARAAAKAEADKLIAEAQKEADQIRSSASLTANRIRKEANTNAESVVAKAKDPISKKVAEEAAKKIRQEGENTAQKLEKEADKKAETLIDAARNQATQLLEAP
jgi:hypothetical protein